MAAARAGDASRSMVPRWMALPMGGRGGFVVGADMTRGDLSWAVVVRWLPLLLEMKTARAVVVQRMHHSCHQRSRPTPSTFAHAGRGMGSIAGPAFQCTGRGNGCSSFQQSSRHVNGTMRQ